MFRPRGGALPPIGTIKKLLRGVVVAREALTLQVRVRFDGGVTNTEKTANLTSMSKYKIYKGEPTVHVVPTIYGDWKIKIKDGDLMKFITYKDK